MKSFISSDGSDDPRDFYLANCDWAFIGPPRIAETLHDRDQRHGLPEKPDSNYLVPIRVRLQIMELRDINTASQSFWCRFFLQFSWRERVPDNFEALKNELQAKTISGWFPGWPQLEFTNFKVDAHLHTLRTSDKVTDGKFAWVYSSHDVKGTFYERMELSHFPFDIQRLHIRTALWRCPEAVRGQPLCQGREPVRTIVFERGNCLVCERDGFVSSDAWTIFGPRDAAGALQWDLMDSVQLKQGLTSPGRQNEGAQYTTLNAYICLRRKPVTYIVNILIPTLLLVALSFVVFFYEVDALNDRITVSLTVLLTLVATKLSTAQQLPDTEYLTIMDKYIMVSFIVIFLTALLSLVASRLAASASTGSDTDPPAAARTFNLAAGVTLFCIWVAAHFLLLGAHLVRLSRLGQHWQEDDDVNDTERDLDWSPHEAKHPHSVAVAASTPVTSMGRSAAASSGRRSSGGGVMTVRPGSSAGGVGGSIVKACSRPLSVRVWADSSSNASEARATATAAAATAAAMAPSEGRASQVRMTPHVRQESPAC